MENKEIRRANLLALADELGTLKALADATETDPAHLSQIKNGFRDMGDDVARRIEAKSGKPKGWMDAQHGLTDTPGAQQLLEDYGKASPEWQLILSLLARLPAERQAGAAATINKVLAGAAGAEITRTPLGQNIKKSSQDSRTKRRTSG